MNEIPVQHPSYEVARKIVDIIPLIMRVMSAEMRSGGHGLESAHAPVLGLLELRAFTISELAERLSVSAPTMSNMVSTLEERGWVSRARSTEDRRIVWVKLNDEGRAALETMRRQMAEHIAALLDGLDEQQRAVIADGLTILRDSFMIALEGDPALRQT